MQRKVKNPHDVRYILEHLRDEDRHEAIIQKGENFIEKCLDEIMADNGRFVLGVKKSDGTPVVMGGCTETQAKGVGIVWMLATPDIVNHQFCLLKNIRSEIQNFDKNFYLTCNMLYKENELAKKWLKKTGYRFDNPHPEGSGIPDDFEFFYRKRKTRGLKR